MTAWKATSVGKNSDKVTEILETNFEENMNYQKALYLVIDCMLQYVEAGSKNIEIAVMRKDSKQMVILNDEEVDKVIAEIEEKKKKEEKK